MNFWDRNTEIKFFSEALNNFASPEQIFYNLKDGYYAYAPKGKTTEGQTLQSRNSLIGQFTEKWCKDFLNPIAQELGLFAVNSVVCPELGLTNTTNADVAFCTNDSNNQTAGDIKLIFEVKMSIVNNYKYSKKIDSIDCVGDYKSHNGNPSILRSDSMLKAIGKSINIRVSGVNSAKIPIIILGNSPITKNYIKKVDFLKQSGVIQGFISLYPNPTLEYIECTSEKGFQTFNNYYKMKNFISSLIYSKMNFFSSMLPKRRLGQIITISAKEGNEISKAEKFLNLLNETN